MDEEGDIINSGDHQIYLDNKQIEPHLQPILNSPYIPSKDGLVNLWNAVEICAQHNSNAALFTFGAVAMNMHFQTLIDLKGG